MLWRTDLLGIAYRRAGAASAGLREFANPLGLELLAPFSFSDATGYPEFPMFRL